MRLSPTEIEKIAKFILKQLGKSGIQVTDEAKTSAAVINLINKNMEDERLLEEDALKLLKQHQRAMGAGLDQEKALRMIKQKLADERKFIL